MGAVKSFFKRSKPKPQPVVRKVVPASTGQSASEIAAEENKRKKQAALVANAGQRGTTVGGGTPDVTKKVLLGL